VVADHIHSSFLCRENVGWLLGRAGRVALLSETSPDSSLSSSRQVVEPSRASCAFRSTNPSLKLPLPLVEVLHDFMSGPHQSDHPNLHRHDYLPSYHASLGSLFSDEELFVTSSKIITVSSTGDSAQSTHQIIAHLARSSCQASR
jgi:hypothetical protein